MRVSKRQWHYPCQEQKNFNLLALQRTVTNHFNHWCYHESKKSYFDTLDVSGIDDISKHIKLHNIDFYIKSLELHENNLGIPPTANILKGG